MVQLHLKKYEQSSNTMVLKGFIYFYDADLEPEPIWLGKELTWSEVKTEIDLRVKKIMS